MLPIVPANLTVSASLMRLTSRRASPAAGLLLAFVALWSFPVSPRPAPPSPSSSVLVADHGSYPELQVDGKPFFIHAAAFLYPRVPRALWETSLDRYRELGINTIDLSIPWSWHEPRPGEYDFDGHSNPRRDLRGLLQLVARFGFKLIARPGPAIAREWRNSGYPDWVVQQPSFRVPLVDCLEGRASPDAALSAAARLWLENVAHELAPYSSAAVVQVTDDGASTRSRVLPAPTKHISGPLLLVGVDSGATISSKPVFDASSDPTEALCSALRKAGADALCFRNVAGEAGSLTTTSIASMGQWYLGPSAGPGGAVREISPEDLAEIEFTAGSVAAQAAFPPALIEYDAGWFAPQEDSRPEPVAPGSTRLSRALFIAAGVRGISWFPLQDTLTPAGFGVPWASRHYRWDAPLALNGSRQPRAAEVARTGDWLRVWGSQLAASHLRADFGLVNPLTALPPQEVSSSDVLAAATVVAQLQRLAQYARLSPELIDPARQPVAQLLRHALILLPVLPVGDRAATLSDAAQTVLADYVRRGGTLVCFPELPAGTSFAALQQDVTSPPRALPQGTRQWKAGAGRLIEMTKDFYSWVSPADELAVGIKRFEAPFGISMLEALLGETGARPAVRLASGDSYPSLLTTEIVSNEGTLSLGERSAGQGWLAVTNLGDEAVTDLNILPLSPGISARPRTSSKGDRVSVPVTLPQRESLILPLGISLCLLPEPALSCRDSVVAASAELVRAEREGKAMLLTFYAPAKATAYIHLGARPSHFEVDESRADAHWNPEREELAVDILRGASPDFRRVLRLALPYQPALPERPKPDANRDAPARVRLQIAGVRLPLGEDAALTANPPLFVFQRGKDAAVWVLAENRGGESSDVQVRAEGEFNTSTHGYVFGGELRSIGLKLSAFAVEKAAADPPAEDGLYHGTLHLSASGNSQDVPVSYAIVPEKGAIRYTADFDGDGSAEQVLETAALRAVFSPGEGGRLIALVGKNPDANLTSPMGMLEDAFSFSPNPPGSALRGQRGTAGMFNRSYAADSTAVDGVPALHFTYDAPDVYPHGVRIEKTARLSAAARLSVDYRVSLLQPGQQRLADEAAGLIFAAPLPSSPVPQSLEILNSVPVEQEGGGTAQFCWRAAVAGEAVASGYHCEAFVPAGPVIELPREAARLEVRRRRRPTLALDWPGAAGARLSLQPQRFSMLLRLRFPSLDPGGAPSSYRIEMSVADSQ